MRTKPRSRPDPSDRSHGCAQLDSHIAGYRQYLSDRGNAAGYVRNCEAAVAHLSMWLKASNKRLAEVDEGLVAEFVEHHLPGCRCATSARHPSTVRASLGHLLVVLRDANAIAPRPLDMTEVGVELRRYDQYMEQVRGLAPRTREGALRLVEALLRKHFGDEAVQFEIITPERVRRFFAAQAKNYKTPLSMGVVISSLRGYFRWRATLGDRTHALVGALAYPANWQLASLPKSLAPAEIEQLEAALGQSGPSMLRADAMVRCMLDLGLRSGEVARLSLDDIDWDAGTISAWLHANPGLRGSAALLPNRSGHPMTRCNVAQRLALAVDRASVDQPGLKAKRISPHSLRHTTAMHLLQSGVPFNVIALWLGHESTNTTHRYVEANLEMKEKALARLEAPDIKLKRFRATDDLMKFLQSL